MAKQILQHCITIIILQLFRTTAAGFLFFWHMEFKRRLVSLNSRSVYPRCEGQPSPSNRSTTWTNTQVIRKLCALDGSSTPHTSVVELVVQSLHWLSYLRLSDGVGYSCDAACNLSLHNSCLGLAVLWARIPVQSGGSQPLCWKHCIICSSFFIQLLCQDNSTVISLTGQTLRRLFLMTYVSRQTVGPASLICLYIYYKSIHNNSPQQ